jgi:hypothetical protein
MDKITCSKAWSTEVIHNSLIVKPERVGQCLGHGGEIADFSLKT